MDGEYAIQLATPPHLSSLAEIEREAAQLFVGWDVPESVIRESTSLDEFRDRQQRNLLWVALTPAGKPVGFAAVEPMEGACHLEELDVHPSHARRGIERAELSWILEDNLPMRRMIEMLGATAYKTYRIFERDLA